MQTFGVMKGAMMNDPALDAMNAWTKYLKRHQTPNIGYS
jgi:hypothetical protein